jgi:arylsulfatase A-like enzyme
MGVIQSSAAERPNIVYIRADEVGQEVLRCYGGESYPTRHLDRLAAEGMRFRHAYAMPVCHPTRVTLLTGQYPFRLGQPSWGSFPEQAEDRTVAQVLGKAGYATAVAGKW